MPVLMPTTDERLAAIFEDPDAVEMRELVAACVTVWSELAALVDEAAEVQFREAPIPRPVEDTTERSKGGHSDPTWKVVQDARRQAVRAFVLDSINMARRLRTSGERALDRWAGGLSE